MSNTAVSAVQTAAEPLGTPWRVETWLQQQRAQVPLWAPVALGMGIAAYFMLPWASQRFACGIVALAAVVLGATLRAVVPGATSQEATARVLIWTGLLVLLGLGVASIRSNGAASPVLRDRFEGNIAGVVDAVEIRSGRGQVRFQVAPDDPGLPPHVRISLKTAVPAGLEPGARISIRAMLSPPAGPSYPGGYDFARRAWFAGIGATGYPLGPVTVTAPAPPPAGLEAWLADLRARLTRRIEAAVDGPAGAISAAFVTGDQGAIPTDVNEAMRYSGMAHLLSISGVHIAIVVGGAMWLTRRLLALSPWIALRWPLKGISAAVAAVLGIGYTLLAGAEVPTVRSCIATVIVLLGIMLGREALSLRLVAGGAFIILLFRPESLLGPSFQLSFGAVTGLVALYQSRAGRWLSARNENAGWLYRAFRHGVALVATGLAAEAMLSATALFHFNQTGTYGVVANLIGIPWTSFVIMPLLVLALVLDMVGLGAPAYWLLGKSMDALIALATHVAGWPGSVTCWQRCRGTVSAAARLPRRVPGPTSSSATAACRSGAR
ncbi:MAG: ComEC/Rec2 family competence protein, partial [Janthinobacterium lividum]